MTPLQIIVATCLYFAALLIVIYFTRATARRIAGAFAGGAAGGLFGMAWRGMAVCLGVVAIIGPRRDYLYALKFPSWMVFAPGVAPIIADSLTYIGIVAIGHTVMHLVAGPSREDRLRDKS